MGPALGEVFLHCAQGWGRAWLPVRLRLGAGVHRGRRWAVREGAGDGRGGFQHRQRSPRKPQLAGKAWGCLSSPGGARGADLSLAGQHPRQRCLSHRCPAV